jgi:hypothetical protein
MKSYKQSKIISAKDEKERKTGDFPHLINGIRVN